MTNDDRNRWSGPDRGTPDHDELSAVESRLTEALHSRAEAIIPRDRLAGILAQARCEPLADVLTRDRARSRWVWSAAAAAAAVAIAFGSVWVANRPAGDPSGRGAAGATTSATTPASAGTASTGLPTLGPTSLPATPSSPPASDPGATVQAVPVYYVGPRLGSAGDLVLFREFVRASVPAPVSPEARARTALQLALAESPAGSAYEQLWSGVTLVDVEIGEADRITIRLSGPAPVPPDQARLAVQQLVWTAQAAAGQGNVPVHFVLQDGSATVAGTLPADADYLRPTDESEVAALLAPLWVDNPARGQVLPAGSAITVTGQASTFEATLSWQLLEDGQVLHDGFATASAGAPARGEFAFTVPALEAGSYTIRVFEVSMADGFDRAEQRIPFSVE